MTKVLQRVRSMGRLDILFVVTAAVGIVLRMIQYAANRSFWVDEASLALNIVHRTFGALTLPLDYNQGAPIGFLFVEKLAVLLLGNNELSLRLFPLLAGIAAVVLMVIIAREQFGAAALAAVALLALSTPLVYYSSELKQYSSDVMFVLAILYMATRALKPDARRVHFFLLGLVGVAAIAMSHPSIFVAAGIGVVLLIETWRAKDRPRLAWTLGLGAAWLLTFGATYWISLKNLTGSKYLVNYWLQDFAPLPPWGHFDWYKNAFASLLVNISPGFNTLPLVMICLALLLIGIFSLFHRDRKLALLITLPFVMALIASAMQKYPLGGRLMLFLVPGAILLLAEGIGRIHSLVTRWDHRVAWLVSAAIGVGILWAPAALAARDALHPPMGEHIKPVLDYVHEHIEENDIIYVYSGSVTQFLYYAPFYGLDTDAAIVAQNSGGVKRFTDDITHLQGAGRIWFVFTHVIGCDNCEGDPLQYHLQIINRFGSQQDQFLAPGAAVFLYQFHP